MLRGVLAYSGHRIAVTISHVYRPESQISIPPCHPAVPLERGLGVQTPVTDCDFEASAVLELTEFAMPAVGRLAQ